MSKKMNSLMKAVAKVVKNFIENNDDVDPKSATQDIEREIDDFLKECGFDDLGVKFSVLNSNEAKAIQENITRIKKDKEKKKKEEIVYYLIDSGEQLHIGDYIRESIKEENGSKTNKVKITEDNIDFYISKGIISKKRRGEKQIPMGALYYIKKIGSKMHIKKENVIDLFAYMDTRYPNVPVYILLREIAITIDHYYRYNIKKCKSIFYISLVDGEIHEIPTEKIKNFRTIAAFRTKRDAEIAMEIIDIVLKELFESDEEYNKKYFPDKQ